jgi:putative transposase
MPANPKIFIKGTLVELCSRIEHGLPLVPNQITNKLIINAMARAQTLYPVTIVSYVIMKNHFHIIIVVQDPANVPKFMEYFKRETSHYVNRLLGLRQNTLWHKRYDSPLILDSETAINRLKYVSLNPTISGFVESSKKWILSSDSWINRNNSSSETTVKRIPRNQVKKLPVRDMTPKEIKQIADRIEFRGKETYTLKIEPHAWLKCFNETKYGSQENIKNYLESEIRVEEKRLSLEIVRPLMPIDQIATQNIRTEHQPGKFGKKMFCFGKDKATRVKFLKWIKDYLKRLPRFATEKGKVRYRTHYPPGFFAPGGFLSANLIPELTPISELG